MMKSTSKVEEDSAPINDFNNYYQFLNNDHPAWVCLDGLLYPSASIAYQAARTNLPHLRQQLLEVTTYEQFKEIALSIQNPQEWGLRKYKVMEKLTRDKFKRSKELSQKLAATYPRNLVNTYKQGGDNEEYWGVINGQGNNALGRILVSIRQEIRKGIDWQRWIIDQGIQNNDKKKLQASLIVIKEDKPIDKLFLEKKKMFFFGQNSSNQFKLDHPSISQRHACVFFGEGGHLMLVDLGSSNGTVLSREGKKLKIDAFRPVSLCKDDVVIFGLSSRRYKVDLIVSNKNMNASQRDIRESGSRSRSRSPKQKQTQKR